MEKSLVLSTVKSSLPSFTNNGVTYNDIAKMFLSNGWTSAAGNTYQEGLRFSDKIAVTYDIGHGYAHSFLNGIRIFRYDGKKTKLIGERYFSNYWWNTSSANQETANLLAEYLESQCKVLRLGSSDRNYVRQLATSFVDETINNTKMLGM